MTEKQKRQLIQNLVNEEKKIHHKAVNAEGMQGLIFCGALEALSALINALEKMETEQ